MNGNERFTMSEIAHYVSIKDVGRTILYRILRILEIVDENNKPSQIYIKHGDLAVGLPRYTFNGRQIYVTLAIGLSGMNFIRKAVLAYLDDHQIPRIKRKPKVYISI